MKEQEAPPTKNGDAKATTKTGSVKPKVVKESTGMKRSSFSKLYPEDSALKLLVKENPKKKGSKAAGRFEHYFAAKTVGDFLSAGGTYQDIAFDIGRNHIAVTVKAAA